MNRDAKAGRVGRGAGVAIAAAIAVAGAGARRAGAEPSNERLVWIGVGLAAPDYLLGVSLHEGSHAIAAEIVGASVDELHLFPPAIDPHTKTFRFGWTYVHGLKTRNEKVFFYAAPKITDAVLLGGFAALVFTDAWPHDRYGQLALTVFGTGLWVDFSKDVVLFSKTNDVTKVFDLWCMHGWRQVAARVGYGTIAAGLGLVVMKSYFRTFGDRDRDSATPRVMPLFTTAF